MAWPALAAPQLGVVSHVREDTLVSCCSSRSTPILAVAAHAVAMRLQEIDLGQAAGQGSHQAGVVLSLPALFTVLVMLLAGGLILYSFGSWCIPASGSSKPGMPPRCWGFAGLRPLSPPPPPAPAVHPGIAGGVPHHGSRPSALEKPRNAAGRPGSGGAVLCGGGPSALRTAFTPASS